MFGIFDIWKKKEKEKKSRLGVQPNHTSKTLVFVAYHLLTTYKYYEHLFSLFLSSPRPSRRNIVLQLLPEPEFSSILLPWLYRFILCQCFFFLVLLFVNALITVLGYFVCGDEAILWTRVSDLSTLLGSWLAIPWLSEHTKANSSFVFRRIVYSIISRSELVDTQGYDLGFYRKMLVFFCLFF